MRVLMVGAGSVGAVLARSLEVTKANEVTYYVRAGRKKALSRIQLLDVKSGELHVRERPAIVEPGDRLPGADTVVLAVRGDQLDAALDVAASLGGEVRIANASAAPDGLARIHARFPGRPAAQLAPLFLAYPDGDTIRWWNPPFARTLVLADDDAGRAFAQELARDLRNGGLPTRAGTMLRGYDALIAAGMPLLASWELAGWDLRALASDGALRALAARGVGEAARATGGRSTLKTLLGLAPRGLVSAALRVAPALMSADAQQMWRVHGPKIAGQTHQLLSALVDRAGGNSDGLRELQARFESHGVGL